MSEEKELSEEEKQQLEEEKAKCWIIGQRIAKRNFLPEAYEKAKREGEKEELDEEELEAEEESETE